MIYAPCPGCGEHFKSATQRKYCSAACRVAARKGPGKPAVTSCESCGVDVAQSPAGGPVAKLCPDCRRAARRLQLAAAQQRWRERTRGGDDADRP